MKQIFLSLLISFLALSCEGQDGPSSDWPWQDPETENPTPENPEPETPETPETPVPDNAALSDWTDVTSDYGTLPDHIKVYRSPEKLQGKKAIAYVAVADMSSAKWDVWSINDSEMKGTTDKFKKPSEVYSQSNWPIVINAGFFYSSGGKNYSSSLAVKASRVYAYNINYASEDWVTIYYPTRAAFIQSETGEFDACWTYKTSSGPHYMYPQPAENVWGKAPAATPSATYPENGQVFAAKTAIGGGPLLINQGKFVDSYVQELFNGNSGIGPDTNQPRTAIGITEDNKMIVFVCEGRQMTEGVSGLTTADVANVLLDLGCVEAINLDGGGSSCMLVNGIETIKVSDGSQRSVGSTIMIK